MQFDQAELEYIALQIPSLIAPYPAPADREADFTWNVAARWNAQTVRSAMLQNLPLSTAPLNHAHDWLLKPQDEAVIHVQPYVSGVRTDIIRNEQGLEEEVLAIILSAGYRKLVPSAI